MYASLTRCTRIKQIKKVKNKYKIPKNIFTFYTVKSLKICGNSDIYREKGKKIMEQATKTAATATKILSENEKMLFTQFRRKINLEAAKAQIKKLEYNLTGISVGVTALKTACSDGNALELGGICVLPGFVKNCASFLGSQKKCSLVAAVSYPHGGDATAIKVKAVKRAVADGADEVEVSVPAARIRDGNYSYVKREFKKIKKAAKTKAVRIDTESASLTKQELLRVCALAADCGINSIKISAGSLGGESGAEFISDVKSVVKDRCTVKAEGITNVFDMSLAVDAGAGVIGSRNAAEVARTVLAAAVD